MALTDSFPYSSTQVTVAAGVAAGSVAIYTGVKFALKIFNSPLRNLPSPDRTPNIFFGDFMTIMKSHGDIVHQEWMPKLGSTFRYRGLLLGPGLCTRDPRAISHILSQAYDFPKPEEVRDALGRFFGAGILMAEGEDHRRQRRVMNPSFNTAHLRELLPIFYDTTEQLKDIILQETQRNSDETPIDMLMWLNRVTLDIIGLAGFDYRFNSLETGEENELIRAFMNLLDPQDPPSTLEAIISLIPLINRIPNKMLRAIDHSKRTMDRVGTSIVEEKKQAILGAQNGLDKTTFAGRDLLSLMIKANMATDIKDSARLTDKEVIDQISTMLLAGHETSSSTLSWLFYELAKPENQAIQSKLREELVSVSTQRPSMEELNALPYLDAVLRELLRLDAVVDATTRCSSKDAVIPLSEPFLDRHGILRTEVQIGKGEHIYIPISAMNRDKRVWGDDAEEFKPERWLNPTSHPRSADSPGVFAGLMTFNGGIRGCIGYRFALLEMKVIIFVLLRNVRFDLPEVPLKIERHEVIVTRPVIKQPDGKLKNTMPLRVTAI